MDAGNSGGHQCLSLSSLSCLKALRGGGGGVGVGRGGGRAYGRLGCCVVVENYFTFKSELAAPVKGFLYHACVRARVRRRMNVKLAADGIICPAISASFCLMGMILLGNF